MIKLCPKAQEMRLYNIDLKVSKRFDLFLSIPIVNLKYSAISYLENQGKIAFLELKDKSIEVKF